MMEMTKERAPRVQKKIKALLNNETGIIENISTSGGFLKLESDIPTEPFHLELKISEFKTIKLACEPQWHNSSGLGFRVLDIEEAKGDLFTRYVENQIQALKIYGKDRVFKTEIVVTLKHTNVFGNVYFSNFIEYQGIVREKFLMATVPDLHQLMANRSIRLVTVDTYNRFVNNAYFGDILVVELTTSEIKAATCRLDIIFKNKKTGALVGEGYQRVCMVSEKGKVMRIPENFLTPLNFYHEIKG
ncbi:MAG: thioesterase family protein [Deltaproteobacteria bacterium]|nr:thioesterase family protein [Deltaproteobacteria bacterium]